MVLPVLSFHLRKKSDEETYKTKTDEDHHQAPTKATSDSEIVPHTLTLVVARAAFKHERRSLREEERKKEVQHSDTMADEHKVRARS